MQNRIVERYLTYFHVVIRVTPAMSREEKHDKYFAAPCPEVSLDLVKPCFEAFRGSSTVLSLLMVPFLGLDALIHEPLIYSAQFSINGYEGRVEKEVHKFEKTCCTDGQKVTGNCRRKLSLSNNSF